MIKSIFVRKQFATRNRELSAMGFNNYQEYIRSGIWKEIKRKIANKKGDYWKICWVCQKKGGIHIHHVKYKNIIRIIIGTSLYPLCAGCHQETHRIAASNEKVGLKGAMKELKRRRKK